MADRKYYCYCEQGCKYETMSKEQILAAITQAVENGTVGNCDTGFIQTIKTVNGKPLRFFVGAQYEYEALTAEEKENLYAIITNDATEDGILEAIENLEKEYEELVELKELKEWKNQQKVYIKDVFLDNVITAGRVLSLGMPPSGKSVEDIVGLGVEVKLSTEVDEFPIVLRFYGAKSTKAIWDSFNGRYKMPFSLSANVKANLSEFSIANMDVTIWVTNEGQLVLSLDYASFTKFRFSGNSFSGSTQYSLESGGTFKLSNVCFWFA